MLYTSVYTQWKRSLKSNNIVIKLQKIIYTFLTIITYHYLIVNWMIHFLSVLTTIYRIPVCCVRMLLSLSHKLVLPSRLSVLNRQIILAPHFVYRYVRLLPLSFASFLDYLKIKIKINK